jgi:hypothetical protein
MERSLPRRAWATLLGLLLIATALIATAPKAEARAYTTVRVTSGADSGAGSFREAVAAASADSSIKKITFSKGLAIDLASPVVYTGDQGLILSGNDTTISGASATAASTWDGGLFVSASAADITISRIDFVDSFNNGIAVFVPESATGTVSLRLSRVSVERSTFHGVYVDGQFTADYNTDDEPHAACADPHPFDSAASIRLVVNRSAIIDNGQLVGGYDDSTATGCPRDFDGIRVDDGGAGGVTASITRTVVTGNLADGVEYDERDAGDVKSYAASSTFSRNGESGVTSDGLVDLDDGFDIDEDGDGDLKATFYRVDAEDNRDEGLDLDEAGNGNATLYVSRVNANRNEDQGVKLDESNDGSLEATISRSVVNDSLSQDGIELTEEDDGDLNGTIWRTTVTGNDDAGVKGEQQPDGEGKLRITDSDLFGNNDGAYNIDPAEITLKLVDVIE